jgi:hypothetical protein
MSICRDMQDDQEIIQEYHCLDIINEWCCAGGTIPELYDTLAFWAKCESIARQRAGVDMLWYHLAEAAEELLVEAKAALRAGRLEGLARAWWPERVTTAAGGVVLRQVPASTSWTSFNRSSR